ncbi:hypothetical protein A2U01_0088664, partial [Trifolium medium]|nr:hypothetical protein [Trifolium medium]
MMSLGHDAFGCIFTKGHDLKLVV